jgi:hypothetical protein
VLSWIAKLRAAKSRDHRNFSPLVWFRFMDRAEDSRSSPSSGDTRQEPSDASSTELPDMTVWGVLAAALWERRY